MNSYLIYLAGAISGLTFEESIDWRQYVIDNLDNRIEGLSPLRNKQYLQGQATLCGHYDQWPLSTPAGIYARDRFDCHRADLVFVNLLECGVDDTGKQIVSIGTCMEIAWSAQNNTPIVLLMDDDNIHNHPMIREACPFIVDSLDEGLDLIHSILLPSSHQ